MLTCVPPIRNWSRAAIGYWAWASSCCSLVTINVPLLLPRSVMYKRPSCRVSLMCGRDMRGSLIFRSAPSRPMVNGKLLMATFFPISRASGDLTIVKWITGVGVGGITGAGRSCVAPPAGVASVIDCCGCELAAGGWLPGREGGLLADAPRARSEGAGLDGFLLPD